MNDSDVAGEDFVDQVKNEDKRHAHTAAEQKRRDAIKHGLNQLQQLVPSCSQQETSNGIQTKASKAQVLQKAIDYIAYMTRDNDQKLQEIVEMEKKLSALKIMKENYEQLVKNNDEPQKPEISDEIKFDVFKLVMHTLYESFNAVVSVVSFQVLSGSIISWLEEYCKPEVLKTIVVRAVRAVLG